METRYHVQFTGYLQAGLKREEVVTNLTKLTNFERKKAENILSLGRPVTLGKDLVPETAQKYCLAFEKAGLPIRLLKMEAAANRPKPVATPAPLPPVNSTSQDLSSTPENPYAAPKANLKVNREAKGGWEDEPQKVPASQGWHWLKAASAMFFERPWVWLGMCLIYFVTNYILKKIPLLGIFCGIPLAVMLKGGLMFAAQNQNEGKDLKLNHIFMGFRHNRNQLFLVGLFDLLFWVAFGILIGLIAGRGMSLIFHTGNPAVAAIKAMRHNILILLVFIAITGIPMMMAYYFAPALTVLTDKTVWNAYKLSFKACRKNWSAFLVYGLSVLVTVGILMAIIGILINVCNVFLLRYGSAVKAFLPMVGILVLGVPVGSIVVLANFTSFRDIFQPRPVRPQVTVSESGNWIPPYRRACKTWGGSVAKNQNPRR